uniref:Uncharacterized protein n=1 Tax=Anopheles maculatus TaxID=74869 RepID=A0A182SSW1_9DIPT
QPAQSYDVLYRILPDASTPEAVATYQDPNYVVFMLHSMGEFLGERSADSWNYVSTNAQGEAEVYIQLQETDSRFWDAMDKTTYDVMYALAGDAPLEYQHNNPDGSFTWKNSPPDNIRNQGLVHEAGTLWMGDDPLTSVTACNGQMHRYHNVYGLGSMLFPRPGSWNPTLTGVAQSFALADELCATQQDNGEVVAIDDEVDWYLEMGAILRHACETESPMPLFSKVKGAPGFRAAEMGPTVSREPGKRWQRLALMLGLPEDAQLLEIQDAFLDAIGQEPHPPIMVDPAIAPCKQNKWEGDQVDMTKIPAPILHDGDGGRYFQTAGAIMVRTPPGVPVPEDAY